MHNTRIMAAVSILALSLGLVGCMGGGWGGGFSMPPTPVETTHAKMQSVSDRFETIGTIEADEAVTVVAEIGGTITRIPYEEGGNVGRGELLAQLDDKELKAGLDRSTALRDQSQATFDRIKRIVDQGAGSAQDLDDASAALHVAEANVSFAKAQHDKTRITAPFAGVVGARKVSPGAYVQPGTPIADMARVDLLRVNFTVPERYVNDLTIGSEVRIATTAFAGGEAIGKVMVIEPKIDARTRSVGVVARLENPESNFRPGMSANVAVTLKERASALTIASEAVFLEQNQPYVYVVKADSSVSKVALQLGSRSRESVEVVGGLDESMMIVKAGQQKIFDGAKVMPVSSLDSVAAAQKQAQQMQADSGAGK
ncbi:MAG: efflux RND transporter periplasmic adaptor subunit [bacterium]|nr:efflux RND transporter periplasmic adaptor subunit [bacterium]